MKKALVLGLVVAIVAIGAVFALPHGVDWLTSTGLLGEERLVRSRIEMFWDARLKRDLATMSELQHPDQPLVADPGMLVTEDYEIQSIEIDGDHAVATVAMHARLSHPRLSGFEREIVTQDRWVRIDGQWRRDKQATSLKQMLREVQDRLHPEGDSAPTGPAPDQSTSDEGGGEEVPHES